MTRREIFQMFLSLDPQFIILEHPSDLGIEAYGHTMEEMFTNAALGVVSIITEPSQVNQKLERQITLQALDRENLLVRWLNEILFLFHGEKFLVQKVRFETLTDRSLKADVFGEMMDPSRHELKLDIKAVTYHQLKIEDHQDKWTARVFVDV